MINFAVFVCTTSAVFCVLIAIFLLMLLKKIDDQRKKEMEDLLEIFKGSKDA